MDRALPLARRSLRWPARLSPWLVRLLPALLPLLLLTLWWNASRHAWMSEQILPAPAVVLQTALDVLRTGELWDNLLISLQRLALGLAVGTLAGGALGAWLGGSRTAERLTLPTFSALAQVPTLAWIPLFMVLFGIGDGLKLAVMLKAVIVPVTLHTLVGVRDAQPRLREAASVMRLPPLVRLWRLTLPAAMPAFLAGVRQALSVGWASLLAVELLASSEGIGYMMVAARQLFMLDTVFVCILVIGLVGGVSDRLLVVLDQRLIRWPHPPTAQLTRAAPGRGWQRLQPWLLPAALLLLWQVAAHRQWIDPALLASPLDVLRSTATGLIDHSLAFALGQSLLRTVGGLVIGASLGLLAGLALGLSKPAERIFGPTLGALRQVAIFAWVPLLTTWFGLGEPAKWAFVALASFFPLQVATQRSVAGLAPQLAEAATVLRLSPWLRLTRLVLPGAAAGIFAGLRLALIFAWLGTIGAEYFLPSNGGIGSLMIGAQQLFDSPRIMAAMLLIGLTGATLNALGQRLESRVTRWRNA